MYIAQNHKKNKTSATTTSTVGSGQKAIAKKALEEKKQAMQREEQQKYIDESVNQRVREGLQLILSRIQVFIEDQIKVKVNDEVALQMKSYRKEMESRRSSRKCSVQKFYEEDLQRKKVPQKAIIKSDKPQQEKELKTERLRQSDNSLKVELQNSIEFTEKVKQEVNSQIQKYQNLNKAGFNPPERKSNQLFKFNQNTCRKRMSSIYHMPEGGTQALACLNESAQEPQDNSMQFNGSFQINLNNTEVILEEPRKCFVMGGRKIKRLSQLKWPRSPSPKAPMSPRTNSERDSNSLAPSPFRRSAYNKNCSYNTHNNSIRVSSPKQTRTTQGGRTEKMAMTERAPRPADGSDQKQSIQVDVELLGSNQDKSFKNWKKAKNGGLCTPQAPQTPKEQLQPTILQDEQPPNGDFTLMSSTRKSTNFVTGKNGIDLHISSVEIKRI